MHCSGAVAQWGSMYLYVFVYLRVFVETELYAQLLALDPWRRDEMSMQFTPLRSGRESRLGVSEAVGAVKERVTGTDSFSSWFAYVCAKSTKTSSNLEMHLFLHLTREDRTTILKPSNSQFLLSLNLYTKISLLQMMYCSSGPG